MTFDEIRKLERARNVPLGDEIFHLVGSAEDNANDTESTLNDDVEWARVALASLELNLCYCRDEKALDWFRSIGFRW